MSSIPKLALSIAIVLLTIQLGSSLACAPAKPDGPKTTSMGESAPSALARVKEKGKLVILTVPHQENSFTKTNLGTGPMKLSGTREDFQGIDIDIMGAFADHLGVELEIRPTVGPEGIPGYEHLIPALGRGDGDIIASSFTITKEREEIIDFSTPYFFVYRAVVTRTDQGLSSAEDLKGKKAVILPGTSQENHLRKAGFSESDILFVEFSLETYSSVLEGLADFTLQDSPSAERVVQDYPELMIAFPFDDQEDQYGFGVAQGSDLLPALDEFLAEMKASGKLEEMTRL